MSEFFLTNPLSFSAFLLLASAVLSLWFTQKLEVWLSLFGAATVTAFLAGKISLVGIFFAMTLGVLCFSFSRCKPGHIKTGLFFAITLFSIALGTHHIPGFNNWKIISNVALSHDSIPLNYYLNFDKPLIGLFLIGFGYKRIRTFKDWKYVFRESIPLIILACFFLLGFSAALKYVRFDLKWNSFSITWLFFNLIFACIAEEAFFRGFLQLQITSYLIAYKKNPLWAWLITAMLFGLTHLYGGWAFALLATVAGLFFGFAYMKTHRLEASILTHFAVNAIHFVAFSYPGLIHNP